MNHPLMDLIGNSSNGGVSAFIISIIQFRMHAYFFSPVWVLYAFSELHL